MQLGMIGLGRMGANMAQRLLRGHQVVVFDRDAAATERVAKLGAVSSSSIDDLISKLTPPRTIWLMIPSGDAVESAIDGLSRQLKSGDVVVDGGNSNYRESMRRAAKLKERGIEFVDVGTSGGVWGLENGYCLMIGGADAVVARLRPTFESLAPAADRGWLHVGPAGAGHFVKMVHNGIEYGMMQAMAEGFALMQKKADFTLDMAKIADVWRHGSVVRSWLLDLTADALKANPKLKGVAPHVNDSGEGRWMVADAIAKNVAIPVITLSLLERIKSRDDDDFANRILAVMRNKFGGHDLKAE